MSTESKKFWLYYCERNGNVNVPELLDLYAAAKDAEIKRLRDGIEKLSNQCPYPEIALVLLSPADAVGDVSPKNEE